MINYFISYNKAQRMWAEWIAWQLEAGYSVIIQSWDFRPSGNFVLDMQRAAEAEHTIAVLSLDYLAAEYTQPEWAAAFAQDPQCFQRILVPIRVRACDVPKLLRSIIYIDFFDLDEAHAKEALLNGINQVRTKPLMSPRFPGGASQEQPSSDLPFPPTCNPTNSGAVVVQAGTIYGLSRWRHPWLYLDHLPLRSTIW